MQREPIRVIHIITGLGTGGAEKMLAKLLLSLDPKIITSLVISLRDEGEIGALLKAAGIPVYCLNLSKLKPSLRWIMQIRKIVDAFKPDLLQGWMYHGNLIALLARRLYKKPIPVIWNIRQSVYSLDHEKRLTRYAIKWGAKLSSRTQSIIYNATTSATQHEALGYAKNKTVIIPNGFDDQTFVPDVAAHDKLCAELNIPSSSLLIGYIARFHPVKDHGNLLEAAAVLAKKTSSIHFVLVGENVDKNNAGLTHKIQALSLTNIHLLGLRSDIPYITAALDIATLTSHSEAFPNVIGEAMSAGVPCVSTDVGDAKIIMDTTGIVVPAKKPTALAEAWLNYINLGKEARNRIGQQARKRIIENYSIQAIANLYLQHYKKWVEK